jgi:hypothetical protein
VRAGAGGGGDEAGTRPGRGGDEAGTRRGSCNPGARGPRPKGGPRGSHSSISL